MWRKTWWFGQPRHGEDTQDLAICAKLVYQPTYMEEILGLTETEAIEARDPRGYRPPQRELPSYKRIYRLVITDQPMIKTTTGKVKRYAETKTL